MNMCSIRLVIIIAFVIFKVFHPVTADPNNKNEQNFIRKILTTTTGNKIHYELSNIRCNGIDKKFYKQDALNDSENDVNTNKQPNRMIQTTQNNHSIPERSEVITRNGKKYEVPKPVKIPVLEPSYNEPEGITITEVRVIRDQVLIQANMYRARHGCETLTLNENINNHAQEWANYLASKRIFLHRKSDRNYLYGEIIFFLSTPKEDIGIVAVNAWYNQLRFIHVDDDDKVLMQNSSLISGVIQLLWKKTREMGIGVAKSSHDEYFIVANYNPKGNVFPYLLANLPMFKQDDIDTARSAHEALVGKMVEMKLENKQLGRSFTYSDNINQVNGSNKYTNGRPIFESNDPDECPKRIDFDNSLYVLLPEFKDPLPLQDVDPFGLSRDEVDIIRQDVLAKSNYYREQMYGFKPLVLHKDIDNYAQDWANYLARTNQFKHRFLYGDNRKYGENVFKSIKFLRVGEVAVDFWYYEIRLLGVNDDEQTIFNKVHAENLTQLLWKSSRQMGVGAAVNQMGHIIIVANYNPPGNVMYFYLYNLPRFTQEQIDEGKRLHKNIIVNKYTSSKVPLNGQLPKLERWSSQLDRN